MKGMIADCLKIAITTDFGVDQWRAVCKAAGLPKDVKFEPAENIEDAAVVGVIGTACEVLNVSAQQAAALFAKHWIIYTKRLYSPLYAMHHSTREFLLAINELHTNAVASIPGAKPPQFAFSWRDDERLEVTYLSSRGLIDIAIEITKALGADFGEQIQIERLSDEKFLVAFP